jgi:hypothetical protein
MLEPLLSSVPCKGNKVVRHVHRDLQGVPLVSCCSVDASRSGSPLIFATSCRQRVTGFSMAPRLAFSVHRPGGLDAVVAELLEDAGAYSMEVYGGHHDRWLSLCLALSLRQTGACTLLQADGSNP